MTDSTDTIEVCGIAEALRRTGLTPTTFARYRQDPRKAFPAAVPTPYGRVLLNVNEVDAWVAANPIPRRPGRPAEDRAVFIMPRPPIRTPIRK